MRKAHLANTIAANAVIAACKSAWQSACLGAGLASRPFELLGWP